MSDLAYDPHKVAKEKGLVVVEPADDELFVDVDSEEDLKVVDSISKLLSDNYFPVTLVRSTPSSTPGHYHVVLKADQPLDPLMRIALQACLGSDRKREALSILRLIHKVSRPVTCFFEKNSL